MRRYSVERADLLAGFTDSTLAYDVRRDRDWFAASQLAQPAGETMRFRFAIGLCLASALIGTAGWREASAADSYPSRRINLVVPFPAGSATDGVTRRLAESIRGI